MTSDLIDTYFDIVDVVVIEGRFAHWCKSCGSLVRATGIDGHIRLHDQAHRGDNAMMFHTPIF